MCFVTIPTPTCSRPCVSQSMGIVPADDRGRYQWLGLFPEDVASERPPSPACGGSRTPPSRSGASWTPRSLAWTTGTSGSTTYNGHSFCSTTGPGFCCTASFSTLTGRPEGWAEPPDSEPTRGTSLFYHLHMAGEGATMAALVTNAKVASSSRHRSGAYSAETDAARAAAASPDNLAAATTVRLLRRWAGLFRPGLGLSGVAATLLSHCPETEADLAPLLGDRWLKPAWPLAEPSGALRTRHYRT